MGDILGGFKGRCRPKVCIRFDAFTARLVSEGQWHASQRMKPLAGGELELGMELGSLEEIELSAAPIFIAVCRANHGSFSTGLC